MKRGERKVVIPFGGIDTSYVVSCRIFSFLLLQIRAVVYVRYTGIAVGVNPHQIISNEKLKISPTGCRPPTPFLYV
jgi:hypothetical protein